MGSERSDALGYTRLQTPRGCRDFIPAEAAAKRAVEDALRRAFESWGYGEVITPAFEFEEVLAQGAGEEAARRLYRFFDREGHLLALRHEMTTPIARLAATRLGEGPFPQRLYYVGNVFRYEPLQAGRRREFWQAGVELVGEAGPAADAEVIALALEAGRAAGLGDVRIDVGHVGFVNGLIEMLGGAGSPFQEEARRTLLRKDFVGLRQLVAPLAATPAHQAPARALLALPSLRGDPQAVLSEARRLLEPMPQGAAAQAVAAVENLAEVLAYARALGCDGAVHADLGMVKDLDYYTGMVLEGYTPDLGLALCTGGRYDRLASRFGRALPATGFAVGVDRVLLVLERREALPEGKGRDGRADVLVLARDPGPEGAALAHQAARALRARGLRVVVDTSGRELEGAQAYARSAGIPEVRVVPGSL